MNTTGRYVHQKSIFLSPNAARPINRRQAAWGRQVRRLLAEVQAPEKAVAEGMRPKPLSRTYVKYVLDGKRGAKPETIRAINNFVARLITVFAVGDYLHMSAVDAGLFPGQIPHVPTSAAVVLTGALDRFLEGREGGAPLRLLEAAEKLKPRAYQRFVVDLKAAFGECIIDTLRGRQTTARLRAICNRHGIRLNDVLADPGASAWLEFVDEVRTAVSAVQPDIPPIERAKLEKRISSAGALLVRRSREANKKGKH